MAYISGYKRRPRTGQGQDYADWSFGQEAKEFTISLSNGILSVRLREQQDDRYYLQLSIPPHAAKALALAFLSVADGATSEVVGTFQERAE